MKKAKVKLSTFLRPDKKIEDKENRECFSNEIFDYEKIWKHGYPVYEHDKNFKFLFNELSEKYYQCLFEDFDLDKDVFGPREKFTKTIVSNNKTYSQLANYVFPEMFDVEVTGVKFTPLKAFHDPKQLQLALYLAHRWVEDPEMKDMRPAIRLSGGVQAITNFKPTAAKCIYDYFGEGLKIFDYSCGWAGRLIGFLCSTGSEYIGVDVNSPNFPKYKELIKTYAFGFDQLDEDDFLKVHGMFQTGDMFKADKLIRLYDYGSEDFRLSRYENYFDLSFSSPPYFSKEVYSDDKRQSGNKFGDYIFWLIGFWKKTLLNQHCMLKPGGHLVINISDIKIGGKKLPLVADTEKILEEIGFERCDYLFYPHSRKPVDSRNTEINKDLVDEDTAFKLEPILVWKKK